MSTYTNNGITFDTVGKGSGLPSKYSYDYNDFSKSPISEVKPFINAVELDWNGTKIDDLTVNTTGELLEIKNRQSICK